MVSLQSLREARSIVRWMLVWLALSIGVAVAAPVVNPQALTLICTTAGNVKFVAESNGEAADGLPTAIQGHALDCVMCLPAGGLPVTSEAQQAGPAARSPQPAALPERVPARLANATSARGPPAQF
jgi:hypothetical protein